MSEHTNATGTTPGNKPKVSKKDKEEKVIDVYHSQNERKDGVGVVILPSESERLISLAIQEKTPVEYLERLLVMRREMRAEKAREDFYIAMSKFQAECPVIVKDKIVYEKNSETKIRYKFAPIDSIEKQVKPLLVKHGFSTRDNVIQNEKMIGAVCIVTHTGGHSEETKFEVPIGSEQYMSEVQKYGARVTFAKRYAYCNALGIRTGDEDTDATQETIGETKQIASSNKTQAPATKLAQKQNATTTPGKKMLATAWQIKQFNELILLKGQDPQPMLTFFNINTFEQLDINNAAAVITKLRTLPDKKLPETIDINEVSAGIENMNKKEPKSPNPLPWEMKPTDDTPKEVNPPATRMQIAWINTHFVDLVELGLMGKDDQPKIEFCSGKEYRKYFDAYTASIKNKK